ncbi:MAG TPA: hypothetical protein VFD92_22400 [Candidatus Binatia bacterium]|nr:hypothetical protein [Candidatus Binatia bacterium]
MIPNVVPPVSGAGFIPAHPLPGMFDTGFAVGLLVAIVAFGALVLAALTSLRARGSDATPPRRGSGSPRPAFLRLAPQPRERMA